MTVRLWCGFVEALGTTALNELVPPGFLSPLMLENRDYLRRPGPAVDHDGPSVLWVLVMINLGALVLRQLFTAETGVR